MRIGLIIADFESYFSSSFKNTARVKYDIDFKTSNCNDISENLLQLKNRVDNKMGKDIHVGLEITSEDVDHVILLLSDIREKYIELFKIQPPNMKIYTINQKIRDAVSPSAEEFASEVVNRIITPEKPAKKSKSESIKEEAERLSKKRALEAIKKNSSKKDK